MENWANRKTLILGRSEMIGLLTPGEYTGCVEQAYRMHGEGRFYMDPKGHIVLPQFPGEWEAMPSYIEEPHAAACKWVSMTTGGSVITGRVTIASPPQKRGMPQKIVMPTPAVTRPSRPVRLEASWPTVITWPALWKASTTMRRKVGHSA